jgi:hypothetical protein
MKKSGLVALGAMLVAGSALASNTGFKLNYPLVFTPGSTNTNWISLPYFYYPNGNLTAGPQTANDLCADLNDFDTSNPKVRQVIKWNPSTATSITQNCGSKQAFNLAVGEGYAVVPSGPGKVVNIVGAMDDEYAPNKGGSVRLPLQFQPGSTNTNWLSVPYNVMAENSVELCSMLGAQVGTGNVAQIVRWLPSVGAPMVQSCASVKLAFNLAAGEAYALIPSRTGVAVAFDVH